eukprot:6172601-Pleurochrysis_carterae.AAC.3
MTATAGISRSACGYKASATQEEAYLSKSRKNAYLVSRMDVLEAEVHEEEEWGGNWIRMVLEQSEQSAKDNAARNRQRSYREAYV